MGPSRLSRALALAAIAATFIALAHAVVMAPTHAGDDGMESSRASVVCMALAVIAGVGLMRIARRVLPQAAVAGRTEPLAAMPGVGPIRVPPERPPRASPVWLQRFLR